MRYSHSKISTFETCQLQYKYRYIDRQPVTLGPGIEAFMGIRVHDALEKLYRDLRMTRLLELDELLASYQSGWKEHWEDNIRVVKKEYSPDDYREKGARCIENYYRRYSPFDQGRTIGIEERIRVELGPDRFLTGFIDRLDLAGDGIYEIHDYKTSNRLPTQWQADHDRQLALYQMDIQHRWDDVQEVILVWHYLVFDREIRSSRSPGDQEELRAKINKIIDRIESTTEFKPKESAICNWCDFQNICPLWKHKFHLKELPPREFEEDDGRNLTDQYGALLDEEQLLKEEKERVKALIIEYCESFNYKVIHGSDRRIGLKTVKNLRFPPARHERRVELEKLIASTGKWDEFSSLNLFKLKKALQSGKLPPLLAEQLEPFYTEEDAYRLSVIRL